MIANIRDFAHSGLNTDITPWDLPPSFVTDMKNIRINGNSVGSFGGYLTWDANTVGNPGWLMAVGATSSSYWLIAGRDVVQVFDGADYFDISNVAGYASVLNEDLWSGCMFGSIPVINHPESFPEYWSPQSPLQIMQDLEFSPGVTWRTEGHHFKIIRSHKDFLIAMNLEEGGDSLPNSLRWSTASDVGGLPSSWDETDPTNLAGKVDLGGTGGDIIDGRSLRDTFVIYREKGISQMVYTGDDFVFRFKHLSSTIGLLAPDCLYEVKGKHIFLGDGDILATDGNSINSLIHNKIRKRLIRELNPDAYLNSYVVGNNTKKEVWFCVPEDGATYPNIAYIWNWKDDTWGLRELPECSHIGYGPTHSPPLYYDSPELANLQYNQVNASYGGRTRTPLEDTLVGVIKGVPGSLVIVDSQAQDSGQVFVSKIERTDYALEGHDKLTSIQRIYPHISGTEPVLIEVGSQQHAGGPVTWKPGVTFKPGDRKVDVRTTGELHAFRISSEGSGFWNLSGLDIEYVGAGLR